MEEKNLQKTGIKFWKLCKILFLKQTCIEFRTKIYIWRFPQGNASKHVKSKRRSEKVWNAPAGVVLNACSWCCCCWCWCWWLSHGSASLSCKKISIDIVQLKKQRKLILKKYHIARVRVKVKRTLASVFSLIVHINMPLTAFWCETNAAVAEWGREHPASDLVKQNKQWKSLRTEQTAVSLVTHFYQFNFLSVLLCVFERPSQLSWGKRQRFALEKLPVYHQAETNNSHWLKNKEREIKFDSPDVWFRIQHLAQTWASALLCHDSNPL